MADWTQTTHGFQVQVSTVPVSGTDATLSGITPFLRFTDTEAGHEDFRLYVDADVFQIDWLSGTGPDVWTNILKITDPTIAVPILEFNKYTLKLKNLDAAAGTKAVQIIVGVEANERWNIENTGEQNWGPGGATAPDTTLSRVAVGVLQTEMLRVLADPSVANDVSRKNYVDVQIDGRVAVAGDTMTGLLTLSGNPTAALHAATKQYVDSLLPAGGAVAKSGDTMTGTLTFDVAANGTILQTKIASEANPRFRFDANGKIEWGPGGAVAPDTTLERVAATDLKLTGSLGIGANPNIAGFVEALTVSTGATVGAAALELQGRRTADAQVASIDLYNITDRLARIEVLRVGANNTGDIAISVSNAGVLAEQLRLTAAGILQSNTGIFGTLVGTVPGSWRGGGSGATDIFRIETFGAFRVVTIGSAGHVSAFASFASEVLTPAQITANQNNYDPGAAGFWRIDSDAARNITGIASGINGRVIVIYNIGAFAITFTHQDAASTAANRFLFSTGANIVVAAGGYIKLIYDSVTARWREIT